MLELPELKRMLFRHLTTTTAEKVRYNDYKTEICDIWIYKSTDFLLALLYSLSHFVGCFSLHRNMHFIMSVIIWIIDIIPILGSIIILAPWALYQFVSGDIAMGTQLAILAINSSHYSQNSRAKNNGFTNWVITTSNTYLDVHRT